MLSEHGPATATELAGKLPVTRQAIVKHLAELREAGLVTGTREGRERRYHLTPEPFADAVGWMAAIGAAVDRRFRLLRWLLEHSRKARGG